jgi:phage/plasmid-like protein (TIGR03299 family)
MASTVCVRTRCFTVLETPVEFHTGTARMPGTQYDRFKVLYRSDNNVPLNVVGSKFKVVQPAPIFTEFFKPAIEQAGFVLDTAGVLGRGERYWALAKTGHGFEMTIDGKKDAYEGYLLLATSCDYSLPTIARFTTMRVVCQNTLDCSLATVARANATDDYNPAFDEQGKPYLRITHRSEFNFEEALKRMQVIDVQSSLERLVHKLSAWTRVKVSDRQAKKYFEKVLLINKAAPAMLNVVNFAKGIENGNGTIPQESKDPSTLVKLEEAYHNAPGATPGTLYGAVQGVTYYTDHVRGLDKHRALSAGFGSGQTMKQRAVALADEFVKEAA